MGKEALGRIVWRTGFGGGYGRVETDHGMRQAAVTQLRIWMEAINVSEHMNYGQGMYE